MSILALFILFVLVCCVVFAVQRYLPFNATIKGLICFAVVILAVLYVAEATGFLSSGVIHR